MKERTMAKGKAIICERGGGKRREGEDKMKEGNLKERKNKEKERGERGENSF